MRNFTPRLCFKLQLVLLDIFDESKNNWAKNLENYENNRNFHGCFLSFQGISSPYLYIKKLYKGPKIQFGGMNTNLLKLWQNLEIFHSISKFM